MEKNISPIFGPIECVFSRTEITDFDQNRPYNEPPRQI